MRQNAALETYLIFLPKTKKERNVYKKQSYRISNTIYMHTNLHSSKHFFFSDQAVWGSKKQDLWLTTNLSTDSSTKVPKFDFQSEFSTSS